jgi:hypothetical protein
MRPTKEELASLKELYMEIAIENCELFLKKHLVYGPDNINELGKGGVIKRVKENCIRLENVIVRDEGPLDVELNAELDAHEEDAWRDTSNFGIIGEMKRRGVWPK